MATAAAMASMISIGTLMDASSVRAGRVIATGRAATGDVGAAVGRAAAGAAGDGAAGVAGAAARGAVGLAAGGEASLSAGCAGV